MRTSALIVTWNSQETIAACLSSLPAGVEIVVVDNASTDATLATIRAGFPAARVIEAQANLGFGAACNLGAQECSGEQILLLNPDAALAPGALARMEATLARLPGCAAVGPRILGKDGQLEASWGAEIGFFREWRRRSEHHGGHSPALPQASTLTDWLSGACMLVRREAWRQVDGFDAGYFLYFEDLDLCQRLKRAGWSLVFDPEPTVSHLRGHSSDQNSEGVEVWYRASQLRYYAQHRPGLERVALRTYLMAKYLFRLFKRRSVAGAVLRLALGGPAQAR